MESVDGVSEIGTLDTIDWHFRFRGKRVHKVCHFFLIETAEHATTPQEAEAFLADSSPDAYERLVDKLLASPHYGERWARHWLDVVHYGDTHGYDKDKPRPNAWPYRDYVIRAIHRDKPFDQFIREQIAGDELSGWKPGQPASPEIIELLEATHFLRNGQDGSGESDGNPDEVRTDRAARGSGSAAGMSRAADATSIACR